MFKDIINDIHDIPDAGAAIGVGIGPVHHLWNRPALENIAEIITSIGDARKAVTVGIPATITQHNIDPITALGGLMDNPPDFYCFWGTAILSAKASPRCGLQI